MHGDAPTITVDTTDLNDLLAALAASVANNRSDAATIRELRAALQQTVSVQRAERREGRHKQMR